jgi:hypothetical protein
MTQQQEDEAMTGDETILDANDVLKPGMSYRVPVSLMGGGKT